MSQYMWFKKYIHPYYSTFLCAIYICKQNLIFNTYILCSYVCMVYCETDFSMDIYYFILHMHRVGPSQSRRYA